MSASEPSAPLLRTPLHALHVSLGARMVPFAGYDMPVQYPSGIMAEHRACRESAALFDVSHMGQLSLRGAQAAQALETLVPADVVDLPVNKQRYGLFTNEAGGILDDLMITRREDDLFLVVNAACKEADTQHLIHHLGSSCEVVPLPDRALLALQGPLACTALMRLNPAVAHLTFMTGGHFALCGADCYITRSGYTGEDGFEISVPQSLADTLARRLLDMPEVSAAGLGARDTLRLEAGLCLYGHDIDTESTPVEAGLSWAIQKVRRFAGARSGGYPGAEVLESQWKSTPTRRRVGLLGLERSPVREGTPLLDDALQPIGRVTSGTLGPTVQKPIAMAYLPTDKSAPGTQVFAEVRGKALPMVVTPMPFQPHRYFRG